MNRHDEMLWSDLRITLTVLIAAHGWARLLNDAVAPFGSWLDGQGLLIGRRSLSPHNS